MFRFCTSEVDIDGLMTDDFESDGKSAKQGTSLAARPKQKAARPMQRARKELQQKFELQEVSDLYNDR